METSAQYFRKEFAEQQREEISTIAERTITLKLSTADVERMAAKAALGGLTVSELLESFIGDLVCGTYSNGSDERAFAGRWYDRCGFEYTAPKSFLRYLINSSSVDMILGLWSDGKDELNILEDSSDNITEEDRAEARAAIQKITEDINSEFDAYKAWAGAEAHSLNEEMDDIVQWKDSVNLLMCPGYPLWSGTN